MQICKRLVSFDCLWSVASSLRRAVLYSLPVGSVSTDAGSVEARDTHAACAHCCSGITRLERDIVDDCALGVVTYVFCACDIQQRRKQEKETHAEAGKKTT